VSRPPRTFRTAKDIEEERLANALQCSASAGGARPADRGRAARGGALLVLALLSGRANRAAPPRVIAHRVRSPALDRRPTERDTLSMSDEEDPFDRPGQRAAQTQQEQARAGAGRAVRQHSSVPTCDAAGCTNPGGPFTSERDGRIYEFCSEGCRAKFER
jgi:hypothetical protein